MLRFLLPLVLLLLVLPIVAHWPAFARYGGRWTKEVPAVALCVVLYIVVWVIVDGLVRATTGSAAAGLVVASFVALLSLPGGLWLGYRLFGVPAQPAARGSH
jgi:hypothetical protein